MRKPKVLTYLGVFEIAIGIIATFIGLLITMSNSGNSSAANAGAITIVYGIASIIGGFVTKEIGDSLSDVSSIEGEVVEQQKRLDFQSDRLVKIETLMQKTLETQQEMLNVMKSLDTNQTVVGNYASEQLCAINRKLAA